jgi:RNA polymerase sigma-70 factor (ECF subfamily)
MPPVPLQKTDRDGLSDQELVDLAGQRDEAAIRTITKRHNRRIYRVARAILRNDVEAEDVVQETYVRALSGLAGFRGEASLGTWLTRIAMNEALGRLRRQRPTVDWDTVGEQPRIQAEVIQFPASAMVGDPERTMAQSEIRNVLEKAIDSLPDGFRMVFVTRIVEGMSVEETAEALDLKPETVKTRLHRARSLLRDTLEKELGPALTDTFPFDGRRCERMTDAVVRRLCAQK